MDSVVNMDVGMDKNGEYDITGLISCPIGWWMFLMSPTPYLPILGPPHDLEGFQNEPNAQTSTKISTTMAFIRPWNKRFLGGSCPDFFSNEYSFIKKLFLNVSCRQRSYIKYNGDN